MYGVGLGDSMLIVVFFCLFSCIVNCTGFDIILSSFAGRGRDPGGAGEVGASAEPAHSRAEKDPQ